MRKLIFGVFSALFISFQLTGAVATDTVTLKPKPVYGKEAKVIVYLLDNNHYRKIQMNDSLSSVVLDQYVESLDNNKTYFLAADLKLLDKYRTSIDDLSRAEDVTPAYEVYALFKKRFDQRMKYVMNNLVGKNFDFTVDEYYETDRSKEPWAKTEEELNDIWRKIIKSQVLTLKLAGKKSEDISETLKTRYERLIKSMNQFNTEDVFSMYMNAITESYDPHTNYFSPRAADLFKQSMSLSLEGIGARLQTENDFTKVIEILPGGPAEKSDLIHVNDRIIGVAQGDEGEMVDVIGWRIDDVVKLIKGPKGTKVRLQFLPAETGVGGKPVEISLVRDKIKLEDLTAKKNIIHYQKEGRNMKLGVITLPTFYMDFEAYQKGDPDYTSTTRDVQKLINELQTEKVNGIVLDLRNNGGGSLAEAIDLTGLFIKNGPVVQVKNSVNHVEVGTDDDPAIVYNGPLVVLTNRFSASASEIFAGAIQDYHRGVVVGESTHGKGTVQTVVDLSRFISGDEQVGELKLTFQKFYRVTGSSTQKKGIVPDIKLPTAFDDDQFGEGSYPNALPWDEISSTLYQKTPIINDKIIAGLNKSYNERLKNDSHLNKFVTDTEEIKKSLTQTRVSLNEAARRKEIEEIERKKPTDPANTTVKAKETETIQDLSEMEDEYLREGILVLTDLISTKIG